MSGQDGTEPVIDGGGTLAWRRAHAGSGITSRLIIAYVEHQAGAEAVDQLLARCGMQAREQRLRDENCWFSFDEKIMLWEAAREVTGDSRIAERVGESALEFGVGLGLKRALRALGSPDFVYRNVVRANSKFNWAHTFEVVERNRGHVRLRYRDVSGVGYNHYDCEYTSGLLRTVPQLFGLPAARVLQPHCGARGDGYCEFEIHWVRGMQSIKKASLLAGTAAAALAAVGVVVDPVLVGAGAGLGAVTAGTAGIRSVAFMRRRIDALETRVREQDMAAAAQLESLTMLSSELKLDEVLDRITASASSAIGGAQFALLIEGGGRMRVNRFSDIPHASLRALESWAEDNQDALRAGSIMIDDLAKVPSLSALARNEEMPLGSACVTPLTFGERLLGVLVALTRGATVFLPHDLQSLETYAGHAAIALSNARLVGQLEREAAEDPLTGLANKRVFRVACAAELSRAEREQTSLALIVLDLDHFKELNDTYGHPYGDRVLVSVADALRSAVRGHDTVSRLGGEEFGLLLPGATLEEAREVADRARRLLATVELPYGELSSSAGVAVSQGGHPRANELFIAADRALYEAKRLGRGRTAMAPEPEPSGGVGVIG
jgi:diguanylate cyclase (GGDEF)-like protein